MTIRRKLQVCALLSALLLILAGISTSVYVQSVRKNSWTQAEYAATQAEYQRIRTAVAALLASRDPLGELYKQWHEMYRGFPQYWADGTPLAVALGNLQTALEEMQAAESAAKRSLVGTPAATAAESVLEELEQLLNGNSAEPPAEFQIRHMWRKPWIWGAAVILLSMAQFALFQGVWQRMQTVAAGRRPAGGRQDEVSRISDQAAAHIEHIDGRLTDLAEAGKQVSDAEYLPLLPDDFDGYGIRVSTDPAQAIREGAEDVLGKIEQIMHILTELQQNMHTQTAEVRESDSNQAAMLDSVQHAVRQGSSIDYRLHEVQRLLQSGDSAVIHTVEEMRSIERDIRGILDVIPIINTLAERTSLLSMNASIESAHAGEHGLGFAVVADEIGKLADQSSQNAESITGTLHSTVDQVQQALQSSENSAEVFDQLKGSMDDFSSTTGDISQSLSELSTGLHEIQRAVQEIVETTTIVERLAATMHVTSELLSNNLGGGVSAADELNEVLQRYHAAIEDFQHGSEYLQNTVRELDRTASVLGDELEKNHTLSG